MNKLMSDLFMNLRLCTDRQREVIAALCLHGGSPKAAAETLETTEGAVHSARYAAVETLERSRLTDWQCSVDDVS